MARSASGGAGYLKACPWCRGRRPAHGLRRSPGGSRRSPPRSGPRLGRLDTPVRARQLDADGEELSHGPGARRGPGSWRAGRRPGCPNRSSWGPLGTEVDRPSTATSGLGRAGGKWPRQASGCTPAERARRHTDRPTLHPGQGTRGGELIGGEHPESAGKWRTEQVWCDGSVETTCSLRVPCGGTVWKDLARSSGGGLGNGWVRPIAPVRADRRSWVAGDGCGSGATLCALLRLDTGRGCSGVRRSPGRRRSGPLPERTHLRRGTACTAST